MPAVKARDVIANVMIEECSRRDRFILFLFVEISYGKTDDASQSA